MGAQGLGRGRSRFLEGLHGRGRGRGRWGCGSPGRWAWPGSSRWDPGALSAYWGLDVVAQQGPKSSEVRTAGPEPRLPPSP